MADEPEDRDDDSLEAQLDTLHAAVAELTTLLPRATGPTAGLPGRIADALAGIDERLAAVERMGREQFELDQRLSALDEAMTELTKPFAELAPKLRHVDQLVDWLGRIDERLHDVKSPESGEPTDDEQLRIVREALAGTVEGLADVARRMGTVEQRLATVQETASAVRAEHATRLVELQRLIEQSRATPPSADGFAAVADAVTRLERRVDAVASLLETLVAEDPRHRTAERVSERIERLRDVAGGVGDAIREELRRRRSGRPPEVGSG